MIRLFSRCLYIFFMAALTLLSTSMLLSQIPWEQPIDMAGRIMLVGKGDHIDVSTLPTGIYIVLTESSRGKFVKS